MRTVYVTQVKVKRLVLNQRLEVKHMGCILRTRLCAMGCEGIKTEGWTQVVEAQHSNDAAIQSLGNQQGKLINKHGLCELFQEHFALFWKGWWTG